MHPFPQQLHVKVWEGQESSGKYKVQNYMAAVCYFGEEDLYQQTKDLLRYNRRRVVEKEVQEQRQQAMVL